MNKKKRKGVVNLNQLDQLMAELVQMGEGVKKGRLTFNRCFSEP